MFNPSRSDVRTFFFETWRKYLGQESLEGAERTALAVILLHPEYHSMLAAPKENTDRDYLPEFGEINPFLHMSMHLAIEEQRSIDQPAGMRAHFERLAAKRDAHEAAHATMDCLGEMIWRSQRDGAAPNSEAYLECLAKK